MREFFKQLKNGPSAAHFLKYFQITFHINFDILSNVQLNI